MLKWVHYDVDISERKSLFFCSQQAQNACLSMLKWACFTTNITYALVESRDPPHNDYLERDAFAMWGILQETGVM